MAVKPTADIKPSGMRQRDLVDLLYDIVSSIQGITQKLDDDGGVPKTTYEANAFTACFNVGIEDSRGNFLDSILTPTTTIPEPVYVTPRGIGGREKIDLLYMILNSLETLTEQLDGDVLTDSTYEALDYIAIILYLITDSKSQTLGNGTAFTFHGAAAPHKELVELLYQIVLSISMITAQLDGDGTVTDVNYTALWHTANILLTVENGAGDTIGN